MQRLTTAAIALLVGAIPAVPQELEAVLYVQNPAPSAVPGGGIYVVWIPPPVLKYCLGKPAEQCSRIDFCIRTTTKNVSTCQNLGLNFSNMHGYPPDTTPRRVLSITYFPKAPVTGMAILQEFFKSQPSAAFDRLSDSVRVNAKIKLTRSPKDDNFDVLEFLSVP